MTELTKSSFFQELAFAVPEKTLLEQTASAWKHGKSYKNNVGTFIQLSKDKNDECREIYRTHDKERQATLACVGHVVEYYLTEVSKKVKGVAKNYAKKIGMGTERYAKKLEKAMKDAERRGRARRWRRGDKVNFALVRVNWDWN